MKFLTKKYIFTFIFCGTLCAESNGKSDMVDAIRAQNVGAVSKLLPTLTKEQLNARDEQGNTVLFYTLDACKAMRKEVLPADGESHRPAQEFNCCVDKAGNSEIAELLIQAGADVNIPDEHGQSLLIAAVRGCRKFGMGPTGRYGGYEFKCVCKGTGKVSMAELLLKHGANAEYKDTDGKTALDYVVEIGDDQMLAVFIQNVSQENLQNMFLKAITRGNEAVTNSLQNALSKKDKALNFADSDGKTSLMYAAQAGNKKLVKMLVLAGADYNIKDKQGKTAVDYALLSNNKDAGKEIAEKFKTFAKLELPFMKVRKYKTHESRMLFIKPVVALWKV